MVRNVPMYGFYRPREEDDGGVANARQKIHSGCVSPLQGMNRLVSPDRSAGGGHVVRNTCLTLAFASDHPGITRSKSVHARQRAICS